MRKRNSDKDKTLFWYPTFHLQIWSESSSQAERVTGKKKYAYLSSEFRTYMYTATDKDRTLKNLFDLMNNIIILTNKNFCKSRIYHFILKRKYRYKYMYQYV